jgi:hypothetical protein
MEIRSAPWSKNSRECLVGKSEAKKVIGDDRKGLIDPKAVALVDFVF